MSQNAEEFSERSRKPLFSLSLDIAYLTRYILRKVPLRTFFLHENVWRLSATVQFPMLPSIQFDAVRVMDDAERRRI